MRLPRGTPVSNGWFTRYEDVVVRIYIVLLGVYGPGRLQISLQCLSVRLLPIISLYCAEWQHKTHYEAFNIQRQYRPRNRRYAIFTLVSMQIRHPIRSDVQNNIVKIVFLF